MGRRVLVTGLSTFWGGRLAQALEADPGVDVIVGLDTNDPTVALERTEFVRADQTYSILARLMRATRVDTILHTFLRVDSTIGTMNLLAAAGAPDSSVRQVVAMSSTLVYGTSSRDPAFFNEEMTRVAPPATDFERSLLEAEGYVRDFVEDNSPIRVAVLRFADVLGSTIVTPMTKALSLPAVPAIFGFDPLLQFVEEDDAVRAVEFAIRAGLAGVFNVAGDGRLPWSEVAAMAGRRRFYLPPLRRLPMPEVLALLRYGRGVDNERLKRAGFRYRSTSAGAVQRFAQSQPRRQIAEPYRYEPDVEQFFRHSAAVARPPEDP